jgi:hypothetical protein
MAPERKRKPPTGEEQVRRVEQARPGARTTDSAFDNIIDAILGADPKAVREHQQTRRERKKKE